GMCRYILRLYHAKNFLSRYCCVFEGTKSSTLLKKMASCFCINSCVRLPVILPLWSGFPSTLSTHCPCLFFSKKLFPATKVESFIFIFSGIFASKPVISGRLWIDFETPHEFKKRAK